MTSAQKTLGRRLEQYRSGSTLAADGKARSAFVAIQTEQDHNTLHMGRSVVFRDGMRRRFNTKQTAGAFQRKHNIAQKIEAPCLK